MMNTRSVLIIAACLITTFTGCKKKEAFTVSMNIIPGQEAAPPSASVMEDAASILRKRLVRYGIADEKITMDPSPGGISLSLNGIDTSGINVIKEIVSTQGNIEFWETFENSELIETLVRANRDLSINDFGTDLKPWEPEVTDTLPANFQYLIQNDTAGVAEKEYFRKQNPLFGLLIPQTNNDGTPRQSCLIGLCNVHDTSKVNAVFRIPSIRMLFPSDLKLLWSAKPYEYDESGLFYELHAIKVTTINKEPPLSGAYIIAAETVLLKSGDVVIRFKMTSSGARIWKRMTADNIDRCIAISVDGFVRSYPRVMSEITGGDTEITGSFSIAEAQGLAVIFNSEGIVLPLRLKATDLKVEAIK